MAVNMTRSQNAEFGEGSVDGSYKKIPVDRSNVHLPSDPGVERREMSWRYGFEDAPVKINPATGTVARRDPRDHG